MLPYIRLLSELCEYCNTNIDSSAITNWMNRMGNLLTSTSFDKPDHMIRCTFCHLSEINEKLKYLHIPISFDLHTVCTTPGEACCISAQYHHALPPSGYDMTVMKAFERDLLDDIAAHSGKFTEEDFSQFTSAFTLAYDITYGRFYDDKEHTLYSPMTINMLAHHRLLPFQIILDYESDVLDQPYVIRRVHW